MTEKALCKLIQASLRTGTYVNDFVSNVCSQVAASLDAWKRARGDLRARITVGDYAEPIGLVHTAWLEVANRRKTAEPFREFCHSNATAVVQVSIDTYGTLPVELWIGTLADLPTQCATCGKTYRTTINAQRCLGSTHEHIVTPGQFATEWDLANVDEKRAMVDKLAACVHDCQPGDRGGDLLRAIEHPEVVGGVDLEASVAAVTEGTCYLRASKKLVPETDLFTAADRLALLGFWMDLALVARVLERELLS